MTAFRLLRRLSDGILAIERPALMVLMAMVAMCVLMNVSFRVFNITLAWADELAVLAMTLAAFVGASVMLRARIDPAVLILHELKRPALTRALRMAVSALATGFGVVLIWLCWRWFNLPGLAAVGFEVGTFEAATFNFLYTEQTPVMGLPYFWFFLVMPWFGLTVTIHAATNLAEDLGLLEARATAQDLRASEG
jgi:TRAP-type C4-dicarboxylate transport system permease small subunit